MNETLLNNEKQNTIVKFKEGNLYESGQYADFYLFEGGRMRKWNGMSFLVESNKFMFEDFKPSSKTIEEFKRLEREHDAEVIKMLETTR